MRTSKTGGANEGAKLRRKFEAWGLIRRALRTTRGRVGAVLVALVLIVCIIGPFIAPHSPTAFVTTPYGPPSSVALLGGDNLGRDVLSRVLCGGWLLLLSALAATLLGVAAGSAAGLTAAYSGGRVDGLIMRCVDVLLAFPALVLALLLVSVAGPELWLVVVAVALAHAPQVARVIRASALDIAERDFVHATELLGERPRRVVSREILPSLTSPLMVEAGLRLTYSIMIIAGLSFLGFGLQPPSPNWGAMINENRNGLGVGPGTNNWGVMAPVFLIAVLTVGVNTLTDTVARVSLGIQRSSDSQPVADPDLVLVTGGPA